MHTHTQILRQTQSETFSSKAPESYYEGGSQEWLRDCFTRITAHLSAAWRTLKDSSFTDNSWTVCLHLQFHLQINTEPAEWALVTISADSPKVLSETTLSPSAPSGREKHWTSFYDNSLKFHIMQQIIGFADEGDMYCWALRAELRGLVKQRPFKAPPIMLGAPAFLKGRRRGLRGDGRQHEGYS